MNKQINKLIPEIRFPEFANDGEWEEEELGNCLDYLQPTHYLVDSTAYENRFKTPVLTAGKTFILGYTNEEYGVFSEKLPVIIFDDFTTASKYVNFPFKAKSSAMKILLSKKDKDIKFVFELMQMIGYEVGAHERHWISKFSKIKIKVPKILEQQKIASCLSSLDEVITAHTNKLETLKTYKKGLMQNLFPQEGEKVPKLRFKEFEKDGDWIEDKLGGIGKFSKGKGISKNDIEKNGKYECLRYGELYTTYGEVIDEIVSKTNLNDKELVFSEVNDVILPSSGETQIDIAKASCIIKKGVAIGGDVNIFKSTLNGVFLSYYLNSAKKMEIAKLSQGISVVHLYSSQLENLNINYPLSNDNSQKEQQKIADTLSSLDEIIKEQSNKIEELKLHKKGLMQGLFPKVKA